MVGLSDGAEAAKEATNAEPPYPPRYGAFCYIFEGGLTSSQNVYFPIASIGRCSIGCQSVCNLHVG